MESLLDRETTILNYEVRLRCCDGSVMWARDSARAVLGRGGKVRYYQGALVDITERKRAEEGLREANEKLRAVIDAAPLAVLTLDPEGRVTSWNPAAERIFDWKASEAIGRPVPLVAERQGEVDELRARVMRGELLAGVDLLRFKRVRLSTHRMRGETRADALGFSNLWACRAALVVEASELE